MKVRGPKLIGVALAASVLIGPATASATIMQATFTGTVVTSDPNGTGPAFDWAGIFGPPNTPLNGDAYTATFLYDTTVGVAYTTPLAAVIDGGPSGWGSSLQSPSLGAVLTINGRSFDVAGSYFRSSAPITSLGATA
jgi:hypothetical protein